MQQSKAREIMGKDFFGIEESIRYLHVKPTKNQILYLSDVPFSEQQLREGMGKYRLIAVFPLSFPEIFQLPGTRIIANNSEVERDWLNRFFSKPVLGWYLIRIEGIEGSESKDWGQQLELLEEGESVPGIWLMFYAVLTYHLATGEKPLRNIRLRCKEDLYGAHAFIGLFWEGIKISHEYDEHDCYRGSDDLRLAACKRPKREHYKGG